MQLTFDYAFHKAKAEEQEAKTPAVVDITAQLNRDQEYHEFAIGDTFILDSTTERDTPPTEFVITRFSGRLEETDSEGHINEIVNIHYRDNADEDAPLHAIAYEKLVDDAFFNNLVTFTSPACLVEEINEVRNWEENRKRDFEREIRKTTHPADLPVDPKQWELTKQLKAHYFG